MIRTIPALQQALYAALTTPAFAYVHPHTGAAQTLAAANIMAGEPVDVPDPKPDPLITFAVGGKGRASSSLMYRRAEIRISVSTAQPYGMLLVEELYAVILDRVESKDGEGRNQLSRAATSTTLPIAVAMIAEVDKRAAAFESTSQRWYLTSVLNAIAL